MKQSVVAPALALALLFGLSGCGGGDGSSSSSGNGSAGNNPVSAPGTTYPAGSQQALAFTTTNSERDHCGFGTLQQSTLLDQSATAHMNYMVTNNVVAHTEDPGKPGFTGVTPATRAAAAGYTNAAIGEVISFPMFSSGNTADAVRRLFAAPYHGQLMLDSARDIGIGSAPFQGVTGLTMDFGFPNSVTRTVPTSVLTYPCEGTTGTLAFNRNETPNPFPDQQNPTWGQPIMLRGPSDLHVTSATITGPQGTVAIQVIYGDGQATDPQGLINRGWAAVMPVALVTNTEYAVSVNWTARGVSGGSNFKFSTGAQ